MALRQICSCRCEFLLPYLQRCKLEHAAAQKARDDGANHHLKITWLSNVLMQCPPYKPSYAFHFILPHLAQRKDPSYRMAEGVVIKSDLTSLPPTHPPTPSRRGNGL